MEKEVKCKIRAQYIRNNERWTVLSYLELANLLIVRRIMVVPVEIWKFQIIVVWLIWVHVGSVVSCDYPSS